jgi:hypothetical protein
LSRRCCFALLSILGVASCVGEVEVQDAWGSDGGQADTSEPGTVETTAVDDPACADVSAIFQRCTGQSEIKILRCTPELIAFIKQADCSALKEMTGDMTLPSSPAADVAGVVHRTVVNVQNGTRQILLAGPQCDTLISEANALAQWAKRVNETPDQVPNSCTRDSSGAYVIDISRIAPRFVYNMEGTYAAENGPNCFNAALVGTGVLDRLTYMHDLEARFWLTAPEQVCKPATQASPGDLIMIRNHESRSEVHGMIYVTPTLVFSKDGMRKQFGYGLQDADSVYAIYNNKNTVPLKCRVNGTPDATACPIYANLYTCTPASTWLKAHPTYTNSSLSSNTIMAKSKVYSIQQILQEAAFHRTDMAKAYTATLNWPIMLNAAANELKYASTQAERFFWTMVQEQVRSLGVQHALWFDNQQ